MLTKQDLQSIRAIMGEEIESRVPPMIARGINELVPRMINKAIDERVPFIINSLVPKIVSEQTTKIVIALVPPMINKAIDERVPKIVRKMNNDELIPSLLEALPHFIRGEIALRNQEN